MTTDLQDIPPAGTPVPSSPAGASVDVSVAGPPPGPGTAEARTGGKAAHEVRRAVCLPAAGWKW